MSCNATNIISRILRRGRFTKIARIKINRTLTCAPREARAAALRPQHLLGLGRGAAAQGDVGIKFSLSIEPASSGLYTLYSGAGVGPQDQGTRREHPPRGTIIQRVTKSSTQYIRPASLMASL